MAVEEQTPLSFNPEAIAWMNGGEPYFITAEEIRIGTENIPENEADKLQLAVDEWNSSHGFYPAEEGAGTDSSGSAGGAAAKQHPQGMWAIPGSGSAENRKRGRISY